jgi:quercetin dioxygenase-like cupin family protein
MPDYTFLANLTDAIPEITPDTIVSRTFYKDDHMTAILFGFAPGQELSEHTSSQTAMLYFVQGDAKLTLGSDSMEAHAGTWAHMLPHLPHSILAQTPVIMLLLMFR